jgi:hypothetical protein
MDVLALDLGYTTGWAYFKNAKVREVGTFVIEDADEQYVEIRTLGRPVHVVIEKPVIIRGLLGDEMAGLIARTEAEYGNTIYSVSPSQWKPHPITRQTRPHLKGYSQHEKDAICIGAWYLFVHLQVEA